MKQKEAINNITKEKKNLEESIKQLENNPNKIELAASSDKNISVCSSCTKQVYSSRDHQGNQRSSNIQSEGQINTDMRDNVDFNISAINIFTNLVEASMQPFVRERVELENDEKEEDIKLPVIDLNNYEEHFKEFLETFKDAPSESSKYHNVAAKMISNNFNVFQVNLKDIIKFNDDLGKFVAAQYETLGTEITGLIEEFIEGLELGVLDHGLHFLLIGQKGN